MIKAIQEIGEKLTVTVDAVYSKRDNISFNSHGNVTATIYGPGSGRGTQINPFFTPVGGSAATSQTVRMNFDELLGPGARTEAGSEDFFIHGKTEYNIDDNWMVTGNAVFGTNNSYAYNLGGVCSSCVTLALNGTTNGSGSLTVPSVPATGVIVTQPLGAGNALDPYNPLSANRTSASVLAGLTDVVDTTFTRQSIQNGSLQLGGTPFSLPSGEVKIAVGVEAARYTINTQRTLPLNIGGSVNGSSTRMLNFPNRTVYSAFAEVLVPIINPEMNVPGVRDLTLNVSGRIDKYNDVGTTKNPRIGANWGIVEGVKLRANWAKSFVAPQVVYIGADGRGLNAESSYHAATQVVNIPISVYPDAATFPGCAPPAATCTIGNGIVTGLRYTGGGPIEPQKGKSWSVGADVKPIFAPGLSVSATYWNNTLLGGITAPIESLSVGTPSLHDRLKLFPGGATPAQIAALVGNLPQQTAIPPTVYYIYDFRVGNVLNLYIQGLDIEASYSIDTSAGKFGIGGSMSKLLSFDQQAGNGARFNIMNTSGFNSTFPSIEWQGRGNVSWDYENYAFVAYLNYIGGYRNYSSTTVKPILRDADGSPIGGGDPVKSYASIDLHASYTIHGLFEKAQLYVDASNIFNKAPSFFNSVNGYDQFGGNPIGRVVTMGFRTHFR